jgi:cold shock CspA family protein
MKGTLIYWNSTKCFGVIQVKTRQDIGWRIDTFYLHASQIKFQTVEEIHEGCLVRFEFRNQRPKPGLLPDAGSAEVFETLEQLQNSEKGSEGSAS